ncbi:unnamed protein product, partial [Prorocentrum cordatum]
QQQLLQQQQWLQARQPQQHLGLLQLQQQGLQHVNALLQKEHPPHATWVGGLPSLAGGAQPQNFESLKNVVLELFKEAGTICYIDMPTSGRACVLGFETDQAAQAAVAIFHGHRFMFGSPPWSPLTVLRKHGARVVNGVRVSTAPSTKAAAAAAPPQPALGAPLAGGVAAPLPAGSAGVSVDGRVRDLARVLADPGSGRERLLAALHDLRLVSVTNELLEATAVHTVTKRLIEGEQTDHDAGRVWRAPGG